MPSSTQHPARPSPADRPPVGRRSLAFVVAALLALAAACSGGDDAPATTTTTAAVPSSTTTTVEAALEQGEQISVYVPEVGDCFDRRTIEDVEEPIILLLDCDLPHEAEVFHVFEVTDEHLAAAEAATSATTATTVVVDDGDGDAGDEDGTTPTTGDDATGIVPDGEDGVEDEDTSPTTVTRSLEATLEDIARRRCPQHLGAYVGTPYERSELEVSWRLPTPTDWEEGRRLVACTLFDPTTERLAGSQRDARR